ncbi:MAG: TIM barrel protein [Clostridia bacterium]|nr:TIM barrel protein [Clostridia bacterium]
MKRMLLFILVLVLTLALAAPAFAAPAQTASAGDAKGIDGSSGKDFLSFFRDLIAKIKSLFTQLKYYIAIKKEKVPNTMNQNAIHMLQSVENTIGDSFIITTEDGKVIAVDGGHTAETDYFIQYLKAVTGQRIPHVDAWFLSHPHNDHVQVFYEVAENRTRQVTFDKVMLNYVPCELYESRSQQEGMEMVSEFNRISKAFPEKVQILNTGDTFNIGAAKITVLYTPDTSFVDVNEHSVIFRMDLGGTSIMFTGDAQVNAGNKTLADWAGTGLVDCDICKMAHHGQDGVDRNFYEAVSPEICLWPTPTWVWDNTNGNLKTLEVRAWMEELGVEKNYKAFEGSVAVGMQPRIVTTTDVFEEGYDAKKAVDRLAALGYDGIDMGFDYWTFDGSPFLSDDYLAWAQGLKARADEKGIVYTHAHAPGEADSEYLGRTIEATAAIGARYLVVHPIWHDKNGNVIKSKLRFLQINADAIKKWLPKAEESGVVLLSENILWGASSDPRIIAELVEKVDSDWFGWCFDVGHAWSCSYAPDVLKDCAVMPMSLHIQDNDGSGDQHLIPGDGTIDWALFTQTLREIGYLGDCVMEAHHQSLEAPDEERDAILSRLLETAQTIRDRMR